MFLRQLASDYSFEDLKDFFEHDSTFSYLRNEYSFGEREREIFRQIRSSTEEYFRNSLSVLTIRRSGLHYRLYLLDVEDELSDLEGIVPFELSTYPVDPVYALNKKNAFILLCTIILEYTYYKGRYESIYKDGRI